MKRCGRKPTRLPTNSPSCLHDKNVPFTEVTRNADTQIKITGVPPEQISTLRNIVSDSFGTWDLVPAPGEANGYLLNMRPSTIADVQERTMSQSEDTIRRRIDQLGLTEPLVAPYGRGENEIIVELPGEGDPGARQVRDSGRRPARNSAGAGRRHPYPSEAAAMSAHNGVLPPNTEILPGSAECNAGSAERRELLRG